MNVQRQGRAGSPARSLSLLAVTILAANPGPIPEINCKRARGSVLKSTVTNDRSPLPSCNNLKSEPPTGQSGPIRSPCKPRRMSQKRSEAFCHWRLSSELRFNSSPFLIDHSNSNHSKLEAVQVGFAISAAPSFLVHGNPAPFPRLQYRVWQTSQDWFRERTEPADLSDIAETERLRVWELSW